jgi:hypothetical protein
MWVRGVDWQTFWVVLKMATLSETVRTFLQLDSLKICGEVQQNCACSSLTDNYMFQEPRSKIQIPRSNTQLLFQQNALDY